MSQKTDPSNPFSPSFPRKALKISEVAAALGIKEISVRRLIKRGLLKPSRVLRHQLIPVSQIDELLRNR